MTDERLPFEDLVPVVRARYRPATQFVSVIGDVGRTVAVTGVNRQTAHRWRTEGLSPLQADRVAGMLGLHPAEIWPTWFELESSTTLRGCDA